ncbi:MAG: hypothetical protein D4R64_05400 [Porphyromonadaceae bacterium]|nr:MAG: hypothetical protein D4R64_05400 [Porphyromonadaceae bacterium]
MNKLIFLFLMFILALPPGCEKDAGYPDLISGFWAQEAILEDGTAVEMSTCEQSTRLLIEQNGVYRLYSSCDVLERSGTWIITNETMLDLSMDRWNGSNKYEPYPVRFTIIKLSATELEIRIRTFIGDRKKIVLFTPVAQDNLAGMTPGELLELDRYNKTLRTYIYRFVKHE